MLEKKNKMKYIRNILWMGLATVAVYLSFLIGKDTAEYHIISVFFCESESSHN